MVLGNGASSSSLNMKSGEDKVNSNKNLSVLVVDDDPLIRMLHDMHLKKFGLNPQVVEDGKKAVDLFRIGASFDLILMDKEMPVMNGVEATKELRDMGINSMIVGVTSRGLEIEMQDFMESGLDFCFEKPLTPDMITFLLNELNKKNDDDNND
ncbi:Two-component response regulator ARR22 [Hibiscus syriacus]|uniref:Two-component response regulator ARR22 n=1 Tax=Hibiscus syriacus TaxID=106335 RepID=A0A6A3CGK2_HIBSY|nr:two-component response regulator 24-like [Hibiscus syriacus]KAE8727936.1 Two-component response regulator ARR22 [Hibiscus syriacus]